MDDNTQPQADGPPDQTTYTSFDDRGRPTAGNNPNLGAFTISYNPDGSYVEHFANGTAYTFDPHGHLLSAYLPDGTTYTSFDNQGRPTAGNTPNVGSYTITYNPDGSYTQHLANGTDTTYDPTGHIRTEHLADGTTYTSFDAQGRPTAGNSPNGSFTITYNPDGSYTQHLANGTDATYDPSGHIRTEHLADGTTYTSFDSQGRPTAGTNPDNGTFTINYNPDGTYSEHLANGSTLSFDANDRVVKETTADGTTFSDFDGQGKPHHGSLPNGSGFTITYDSQGNVYDHFADGSTVESSPDGNPIQETTANGTTFSDFDANGRPQHGRLPDGTPFTITYDAQGDTFDHFSDGSGVEFDPKGRVIKTWTPDGVEITWAVDIPALGNSIVKVSGQRDMLVDNVRQLKTTFVNIENHWKSPAGTSFTTLSTNFNAATDALVGLLDEAVSRMRTAYNNYVATESTNAANLN
jgi:YD repeat-containing protein